MDDGGAARLDWSYLQIGQHTMPRIRRSLLLALGLTAATCTSAHDTLPAEWCLAPNTSPTSVGGFRFTPAQLAAYREAHEEESGVIDGTQCNTLKTCGIVDDWYWADRMAHDYCDGGLDTALPRGAPLAQAPMPFIHLPTDFNLRGHHTEYRFSDGDLVGVCVACPVILREVDAEASKRTR